jgi:alkylhydroperoxidase/carboxymuconolactone decarboxylase family protein YurZ
MNDDRIQLANETTTRMFKTTNEAVALPGEPESAADLRRILNEHAFADSWTRTALDDRTRSIVTVAVLATLGSRKLRAHAAGALALGVTPDELVDLFVHLAVYAGVPRAADGWDVVSEVLVKNSQRDTARRETDRGEGA